MIYKAAATLLYLSIVGGMRGINATSEESSYDCIADGDNDKTCKSESTCKYYLAPSSIPNSGFGVYTTHPIKAHDPLTETSDAPSVMVFDGEAHAANKKRYWNMHDYFWGGEGSGEYDCSSVEELVVTFGTSCNFHTYLKNVYPKEDIYDDTMTHRSSGSPGIGAYSYYGGALFLASRDIEAGEELFADYGEEWLDGRPYLDHIPREEDHEQAGEVLAKLAEGLEVAEIDDAFLKTVSDVIQIFNTRISKPFIPKTAEEFKTLFAQIKHNITGEAIANQLALNSLLPRSMDWILSEGKCLDNLIAKKSTVSDAGRGAFAQRFIPKGGSIVIAPLLHIMDYTTTFMYPLEFDEDGKPSVDEEDDEPIGKQLITNYCFSHDQSTMLLCPQTNAITINHCSERGDFDGDCSRYNENENDGMRGANAEIRWADDWDTDTKTWLKKSIKDITRLVKKGKRGLSLEVVAKRDIFPGDEVFLDYGVQWEEDWNNHVESWEPPSDEDYVSIKEMTDAGVFRTPEELEIDPYPSNIMTACFYFLEEGETFDPDVEDDTYADDWISDGSEIAAAASGVDLRDLVIWPCDVLSREKDENGVDIYEVEIFQNNSDEDETVWFVKNYRRILTNVTKDILKFRTTRYTNDQHLPGVFRSFLRIPDEMFPEQWKDRA
mmetsp:Transcript_18566/g.27848  ORF Transcript_18566/g.27848 Transcript_18566/m.27848 type:complete len:662 (+) Transcript_18566:125-2110(+)|eukprot:CAMPEP_0203663844 /NCGR_PEP_ID=MMETSP0090-20130426/1369_1 /ASSEMBLY_ACC=CAM_ASM_001088 /TAXON_ID=426623 /ORGANISM="Chaetoceros affinis, Strain CCMP159" /LENGTH=661 /DNA_ID=CAMNT_0050526889 /DNA_START=24 /DNA_END=2009 /DNA_ORIENTATION=+